MLDDACIFYLAGLPTKTFQVVESIFELYSVGQLKDQKKGPVDKRLDLKGIYTTVDREIFAALNFHVLNFSAFDFRHLAFILHCRYGAN